MEEEKGVPWPPLEIAAAPLYARQLQGKGRRLVVVEVPNTTIATLGDATIRFFGPGVAVDATINLFSFFACCCLHRGRVLVVVFSRGYLSKYMLEVIKALEGLVTEMVCHAPA